MSTVEYNEPKSTGGNKRTVYIVIIALLVLLNAFFIWKSYSTEEKFVESDTRRMELDSSYNLVKADLQAKITEYEQLMGENATLDSVLQANINELQGKQNDIEKLIKEKNWSTAQYNKAKKEIANLKMEKDLFATRIDSISNVLQLVVRERDSINTNLQYSIAEGEKLKGSNQVLGAKVEVASLLKPQAVTVTGVRFKGSGKEVETNSAKKSEKLRFCFDVPENQVADAGEKTILVRVINPKGETIAMDAEGSGLFVLAGSGEQKQYTTKATFDYSNKQKHICLYWRQTAAYAAGKYKAEFYQNGNLLGQTNFELK